MLAGLQTRSHRLATVLTQALHRARYAPPPISVLEFPIVDQLETDGVAVTSLDDLGAAFSPETWRDLTVLFTEIPPPEASRRKQFIRHATPSQITALPEILLWGLDVRILNIVGSYLRQPPRYRGVIARIDSANGIQEETRLWHIDAEDFRIVKVIIYMHDVGCDDGPFEFVPKPALPDHRKLTTIGGRVHDQDMASLVPPEAWRACTGPAGTVVVADTCSVYHRGRAGTGRDRQTLFYSYNVRRPLHPQHCRRLYDPETIAPHLDGLTPAQLQAIAPYEGAS